MSSRFLVRSIVVLLFLLVILVPFVYFHWGVQPYIILKASLFQALAEFIFVLWVVLAVFEPTYRPRPTPLLVAGTVFLAALLAATFHGVDPWRSFFSTYERGLGVVAAMHFLALALAVSSLYKEIPWRKLLYGSLAVSALVSLLAWLQLYIPDFLLVENIGNRPGATFGNPTFMTGYLLFHIFLALYFLFDVRSKRKTEFFLLFFALVLDVSAVFLAQTRGDILGLAAGVFFSLAFFAVRPPETAYSFFRRRALYVSLVAAVVVAGGLFLATRTNSLWSRIPGVERFQHISFSATDAQYMPRLIALKAAWKGFSERPLLGWGPENFNIVFNKYYDPRSLEFGYSETRFDKPHNVVAEELVSGGVVLFLAWLGMLFSFVGELWRLKDRTLAAVLSGALLAYFISELFVFETIGPLLMLYLLFGFVDGAYRVSKEPPEIQKRRAPAFNGASARFGGYAAVGALALAAVLSYCINVTSVVASYYQFEGYMSRALGAMPESFSSFKAAAEMWSPYRWNFERDAAAAILEYYFYNPGGAISDSEALRALGWAEDARDSHPLDAYNYYSLVNLYNEISRLDIRKYAALAENSAERALALSPNRQEVYFYLAKTKTVEGNPRAALELLQKVVSLDPNIPDSHFYYGLVAYSLGDQETGYREIKEALALGRQWKNFYEVRAAAAFFGDSGHLEEARHLYRIALSFQPDDIDSEIKLGIANFLLNDRDAAKRYLEKAVQQGFDFKKSPSYDQLKPILDNLGLGGQ